MEALALPLRKPVLNKAQNLMPSQSFNENEIFGTYVVLDYRRTNRNFEITVRRLQVERSLYLIR